MKNTPIKGKTKLIGFLLLFRNVDISMWKVSQATLRIAIKRYYNFLGNHLEALTTCEDNFFFFFWPNPFH